MLKDAQQLQEEVADREEALIEALRMASLKRGQVGAAWSTCTCVCVFHGRALGRPGERADR